VVVAVLDLVIGRGTPVVLGVLIVAPMLAAMVGGARLTAAYGLIALAVAAGLGVNDAPRSPGRRCRLRRCDWPSSF
jgi:hypothetical protein